MKGYDYLIIGGGMTADAAARGIREIDETGTIALFSLETDPPYNRPLLSKGFWKGKPVEKGWRRTEQWGADLHLASKIIRIDPQTRQVIDEKGNTYSYQKLLLATGGEPRRLPFGGREIIYFRTLEDYRQLRSLSEKNKRFAVIGGGFIGSEIAAALAMNGKEVTMIFPEESIGARVFPAGLSHFLNDYFREKGIEVQAGKTIEGLESKQDQISLTISGGQRLAVNGVVAGLGILPSTELAQSAGLEVQNGIIVTETLQTSHPDIFAAGDVASFYNPTLNRRMRVEHEDNSNTMGLMAGHNMAASLKEGSLQAYHYLPYFYSDLFDLGYEAVGELDSRLETVEDWKEPYRKGIVYYLKDGRVKGVLLWDVWSQIANARKIIEDHGPFRPEDLIGKIQV